MYEMAKSAREALKNKARRLAGEPQSDGKTDSSSVKRPSAFTAEGKTGLKPTTRRAYKKGGAVKREGGGRLPGPEEAMESEARQKNIRVKDSKMPDPEEAAERSGKAPQDMPRKSGGRAARKKGGSVTVINLGKGASDAPVSTPTPPPAPMPMAAPPMPPAPMPNAMPQGGVMPPQNPNKAPLALKKGGRAVKVAKSYKDMRAGAGSGEGRLQKTDIAKRA